jgi:hypothetical protein
MWSPSFTGTESPTQVEAQLNGKEPRALQLCRSGRDRMNPRNPAIGRRSLAHDSQSVQKLLQSSISPRSSSHLSSAGRGRPWNGYKLRLMKEAQQIPAAAVGGA